MVLETLDVSTSEDARALEWSNPYRAGSLKFLGPDGPAEARHSKKRNARQQLRSLIHLF